MSAELAAFSSLGATRSWAHTPAVIFGWLTLALCLPPLGSYFLFTFPLIVTLGALGVGFAVAAMGGGSRRKAVPIASLVMSAFGLLYCGAWLAYWFVLPIITRPDGMAPGV